MHSDVMNRFRFELGMMIDIIILCIFILVEFTLILIQGHRSARKQKLLYQLSHLVFNRFEWNLVDC